MIRIPKNSEKRKTGQRKEQDIDANIFISLDKSSFFKKSRFIQ